MNISLFDLFKIGIGPSSSHTVGPMKASNMFIDKLKFHKIFNTITRVEVTIYGSLALTGEGHGTVSALIIGLAGHDPKTVPTDKISSIIRQIRKNNKIILGGEREISFDPHTDIIQKGDEVLPIHTNGMTFKAFVGDELVREKNYYSIGGGFVVGENKASEDKLVRDTDKQPPYLYRTAEDLLNICRGTGLKISQVIMANERAWRSEQEIHSELDKIWTVMKECVQEGLSKSGKLPGKLGIQRRAMDLHEELKSRPESALRDPLTILDWINLYALAVNEQNASYGRVVTAPTNGAAGIIPAVLHYYTVFCNYTEQGIRDFLLTAGGIGILYKENASISGAEVGCQGEVGVACSMAAAALTEVLGGTTQQVENAAEIGMEHNLGLTCDPIGGLVQIPCIERNAMASVKAINASRMALKGKGKNHVTLDQVMKTMKETGMDMQHKYKETALGGLAVNVTEC